MTTYKAIFFAPDGDMVHDFPRDTIEEVEDAIANVGSRWIFYPFPVVIVDHGSRTTDSQRIVKACEPYEWAEGKALRTFGRWLNANPEWVQAVLGS